jgi:hypothetical protein
MARPQHCPGLVGAGGVVGAAAGDVDPQPDDGHCVLLRRVTDGSHDDGDHHQTFTIRDHRARRRQVPNRQARIGVSPA